MINPSNERGGIRRVCSPEPGWERLVLGLTGNPGAGKSTVAGILAESGAVLIDGDALGYSLLQPDSPVFPELLKTFGESILDRNGQISRRRLGELVFHDSQQLEALNRLVHPPILREIRRRIGGFRNSSERGPLIVDAALIYEWNIEEWFDAVMVVIAPRALRKERFIKARGNTKVDFEKREASQLPESYKKRKADFVIDNDADLEVLRLKIQELMANDAAPKER